MESLAIRIRRLLRPTETPSLVTEGLVVGSSRRIAAVIVSRPRDVEEACVFLLAEEPTGLVITDIIGICYDCRISITQSKAVDLEDEKSIQDSKSEFLLILQSGGQEYMLKFKGMNVIQPLVTELRRLAAIAQSKGGMHESSSHQWMTFYESISKSMQDTPPASKSNGSGEGGGMEDEGPYVSTMFPTAPTTSFQRPPSLPLSLYENASVMANEALRAKQAWVNAKVARREAEYSTWETVRVRVGTWNVNGRWLTEELDEWVGIEEGEDDILVIGLQEMDRTTEAYLIDDKQREDHWANAIRKVLEKQESDYVKIISKQLVGMLIIVFAKAKLEQEIRDVSMTSAGVGIMGIMGNKGAVAVRFQLRNSLLCFVNAHFAANVDQTGRRNQNYEEICRRVVFTTGDGAVELGQEAFSHEGQAFNDTFTIKRALDNAVEEGEDGVASVSEPSRLFLHNYIFWMGDLNYRVNMGGKEVAEALAKYNYEDILKHDQLSAEIESKRVLEYFQEGAILFAPSYKYDIGTDNYDTSEKKRVPAWCDRILWRTPQDGDKDRVTLRSYRSHMDYRMSDHKPVSAGFNVEIKRVDEDKRGLVQASVIRQLDKMENDRIPDASISSSAVDLGAVEYLKPESRMVTMRNTGQVMVQYRFVPKHEEAGICKPWLWVNPPTGLVMPGEKAHIHLRILVEDESAALLNLGLDPLEDILILHLENGKDFFIQVSGTFVETCFAQSLDRLVRLSSAVRAPEEGGKGGGGGKAKEWPSEQRLSIPRELWRMCDYLYRHAGNKNALFMLPGDVALGGYIRECLDTGREFDDGILLASSGSVVGSGMRDEDDEDAESGAEEGHSLESSMATMEMGEKGGMSPGIHSMGEMLLRFLEALPEPVIPFALYGKCVSLGQKGDREAAAQVLEVLPRTHLNVFTYLISFIREVLWSNGRAEAARVDKLAMIFSTVLLRPKVAMAVDEQAGTSKARKQFIMYWIDSEDEEGVAMDD